MTFLERIKILLVIAFAKYREFITEWNPLPLMRRTTPSGGSRHPIEGYLVSYNLPNIEPGWYHVQADPCELVRIKAVDEKDNTTLYENTSCLGAIVLTSAFRRTMYKYREPRAFRVPHMDAGHMLTTIEIIAKELDIPIQFHLNFKEAYILDQLSTSPLDEGVMAVITISNRKEV